MSKGLELYKAFIDGLVKRKDSMTALWVKGDGFPKTEDNKANNDLLATLTPEQKGVLSEIKGGVTNVYQKILGQLHWGFR